MPSQARLPGTCRRRLPRLHQIGCAVLRAHLWRPPVGLLMRAAMVVLAWSSVIAALDVTA
jgi:hypothetical protein